MSVVLKRLKLNPSRPGSTRTRTRTNRPPRCSPQLSSHDALLHPPAPEGAGAQDQEEEGYLLVEEDTTDSSLIITMEDRQVEVKAARKRVVRKRKRKLTLEEEKRGGASESEAEVGVEMEIDRQLDQSLETKSKQHNLTTVNVRNIIHEVITNEHVVAMMKAAINDTEAVPAFEPKMTRSKFKEVVEKGVVIPAWNISPIKKTSDVNKAPQFVDIPLAEEDSSDEEYHPDEEDEDETAEDTFQESDMESSTSSPRGSRLNRVEEDSCSPWQTSRSRSRRLRAASVSMGPPPPPKAPPPKAVPDCTFLEKLHAVEEELAVCIEPYQSLPESEDEVGLMAYRTRSKRPLRDVPLGRLEAELRAPDITPDMYESSSAHEDRDWTDWLRGLMTSDMENEEECDDEDDPEYNFLADTDEPDVEDYRDDKAVRITKKEVNELMEELFETLKEDLVAEQEVEDEGHEEEEEPQEECVQTHLSQEQHDSGPRDEEDEPITELRTVKQQVECMRKRRQLGLTRTHSPEPYTLKLSGQQRSRLQQQLQQHVQLLTQIHLLSSPVVKLKSEAETSRQFLFELDLLAQRGELLMSSGHPGFCSFFRASNLKEALLLLEELQETPIRYQQQVHPLDSRGHMRCFPVLPAELSWIFSTRLVFLYPELLPSASLDPDLYCPRRTTAFTAAEDCLLVLGLRNMEGSCDPTKLVSQFLVRKTLVQVRRRILQCCRPGSPDNIVKAFRYQRVLWPMLVSCRRVDPAEQRPPVEREEEAMPLWLLRSLPAIYTAIKDYNSPSGSASTAPPPCQTHLTLFRSSCDTYCFPPGTRYPPRLPKCLDFRRIGFVLQQPLPHRQTGSSPVSDRQTGSSSLPHRQTGSSPVSDRQTGSYPVSDRQTGSSPVPHRETGSFPLPHRQTGSSPVSDRQTGSYPVSDRQTGSSPVPHRETGSFPLPHRQTGSSPPQVLLRRLLNRTDTREQIRRHYQTLTSLRRESSPEELNGGGARRRSHEETVTPPTEGHAPGDVTRTNDEEEEEEESEVLLVLSDSSPSSTGSEETESGREREVTSMPCTANDDDDESFLLLQEASGDEDDQRQTEDDEVFAEDYLLRVCEAVQGSPGVLDQLLQVLDQWSSSSAELLFRGLSRVLRPWPQLLRDFAAFLNHRQARRCGLLTEQRLFERSRRFLRRLRRSLGEDSSPFRQVVSVLQGSSAPSPEDMVKISSLLRQHAHLHREFWEFFQQLHGSETDYVSQNPLLHNNGKRVERWESEEAESEEAEPGEPVCAKNMSMTSTGEKVVEWTREADRSILTACQQRGANRKTFRQVSSHLGNKTAQQVSLRFSDLMNLFHSANLQKSTSCSSED
ncbi:GON-4-like protein [Cebidichthys violaceus]|uniref:GON-4-like protein n=1 Tax=Cebidichthys violaceus TaxID=271503 RepID=UPI0035CC0C7D